MKDRLSPPFSLGVRSVPLAGETVSGDAHLVAEFEGGALLAVVDGLGHGQEAAIAAHAAIEILRESPSADLVSLLQRCHVHLNKTRGAVMSLAAVDVAQQTLTWIGVGNVEAVLVRAPGHAILRYSAIVLRGGVVGHQLPPLRTSVVKISPGDHLIFATDGVRPLFWEKLNTNSTPDQTAEFIYRKFSTGTDDALVLVAQFNGAKK